MSLHLSRRSYLQKPAPIGSDFLAQKEVDALRVRSGVEKYRMSK
jgi:hypothetical protein